MMMGGLLQVICGIWEINNGVLFGAWSYIVFGCHWIAFGTYKILVFSQTLPEAGIDGELGRTLIFLAFASMLFVVSFRISYYHIPMTGITLLSQICYAIGIFYPTGWMFSSGVLSIMAGCMAYWLSFAQVVNEYWRSNVLPWWPYIHPPDKHVMGSATAYFPRISDHIHHGHFNHHTYTTVNPLLE